MSHDAAQPTAGSSDRPAILPPPTATARTTSLPPPPTGYVARPSRLLAAVRAAEVCSDAIRTAGADDVTWRPGVRS